MAFGGRGTDDFTGDVVVKSLAQTGFKRFFHAAIFAGVKRKNGDVSAGIEARGKMTQERVER